MWKDELDLQVRCEKTDAASELVVEMPVVREDGRLLFLERNAAGFQRNFLRTFPFLILGFVPSFKENKSLSFSSSSSKDDRSTIIPRREDSGTSDCCLIVIVALSRGDL